MRQRPVPEAVDAVPESDPTPIVTFAEFGLDADVLAAVADMGYEVATPIQAQSLPIALAGHDMLGQSHTGSGKTAAFGIPIVQRVRVDGPAVQALVLCPTRELCVQVHEELTRIGAARKVISVAIYGGESIRKQLDSLRENPQVVVATPGRLLDHVSRHSINLSHVKIAVLDEADRMLDMGFAPDVEKILRQCPSDRQTMLFSATMPEWVRRLAMRHMREPVTVAISTRPEIVAGVRQLYVQTTWADKVDVMMRILDQPDVVMSLIFVETKRTADLLKAQLERRGQSVGLLHGDLTQRERNAAMAAFVATHVKHLIATNVAARGLDIDDISHVINYDVPTTPDEYLHRVGRTARAGRSGVAITLITPSEILKLRDVEKHARTTIEAATLDDFPVVEPASAPG